MTVLLIVIGSLALLAFVSAFVFQKLHKEMTHDEVNDFLSKPKEVLLGVIQTSYSSGQLGAAAHGSYFNQNQEKRESDDSSFVLGMMAAQAFSHYNCEGNYDSNVTSSDSPSEFEGGGGSSGGAGASGSWDDSSSSSSDSSSYDSSSSDSFSSSDYSGDSN